MSKSVKAKAKPTTSVVTRAAARKQPAVKKGKRRASKDSSSDGSDDEEEQPRRKKKKMRVVTVEESEDEESVEEIEHEGSEEVEEVADDAAEDQEDTVDLELHQQSEIPEIRAVKKDSTRDILLIFTDIVTVKFLPKTGEPAEVKKGRWCKVCKESEKFVARYGKRKCFHVGGNSSCRAHIRQHYEVYKTRCAAEKIPVHHWSIPRDVWRAMEKEKEEKGGKAKKNASLDGVFEVMKGPQAFSRQEVLKNVAKLIACDDQALALADKALFRNCLVSMRPKSTSKDLPSTYDVGVFLHNEFIEHLKIVRESITTAPGLIATTDDAWTCEVTKEPFMGMTGHWIDVDQRTGAWTLRSEVLGFKTLSGAHSGENLGRYFIGLCERVGIIQPNLSKLFTITLDNASNNTGLCETVERFHQKRNLGPWKASENQLPCLEHVVQLAIVDVMGHITKLAAIETTTAIWEYDPDLSDNRILNGSLDAVAAIRTLAIKMQASGQRIEYFDKLQIQCGISTPLKIPLHNNTRWGTAYMMMERAVKLRAAINLFVASADELFGHITTIRREGKIVKNIPWSAFKLGEADWNRVTDAKDILADSNRCLHYFSSDKRPTLWRALPAIEELQTAWEEKQKDPRFDIYQDAIQDGLDKLQKYYSKFDEKPNYVLALVLHPYYKLEYIRMAWGGAKEQQEEIKAGNKNARNWHAEAQDLVEATMARYWRTRPGATTSTDTPVPTDTPSPTDTPLASDRRQAQHGHLSDFDRWRETLIAEDETGWEEELRSYLKTVPKEVTKDTDIIEWWSKNQHKYPTLARIALDILPCQASSVPCERLFSGSKQTATDRRARLGASRFEELQIMKSAWRGTIVDFADINSWEVEIVKADLDVYAALLDEDVALEAWDIGYDEVSSY
ncbi:hypothetical protein LshimejAT787_0705970 [Lyophyllum shimeji]|uniref:HAT C-terminal dimerisation domain-containing protein n=1 Tax=Lyophyllum shimeji TaxID=47721 RepID=A0A9P3PP74_LYOSH|nr:hypothetical protein LshimejAT787_0705970 [Lyophyllum shimeji]